MAPSQKSVLRSASNAFELSARSESLATCVTLSVATSVPLNFHATEEGRGVFLARLGLSLVGPRGPRGPIANRQPDANP